MVGATGGALDDFSPFDQPTEAPCAPNVRLVSAECHNLRRRLRTEGVVLIADSDFVAVGEHLDRERYETIQPDAIAGKKCPTVPSNGNQSSAGGDVNRPSRRDERRPPAPAFIVPTPPNHGSRLLLSSQMNKR
jgi:hypothetical protein